LPVSQDEPADEGQDELSAAFEALGGRLTWDELTRLIGSGRYRSALVWQAALLLGGDTAAAEQVVQASFAALQDMPSRPGDPGQARFWLCRAVLDRSRSLQQHRAVSDGHALAPAPDAPGAGQEAIGGLGRDAVACALGALPVRQREAVVARTYMRLSQEQAAAAMHISIGAMNSHLARGISTLRRPPGPHR
jgi:DNA-directed RNA polymerase specialized sigma24 family protein